MADVSTDPRKYLDPKTLVKIGRLDLVARLVVEGFVTGLHKSPFHGFSVEFAEHREYVPGDDVRYIDWKVYGKSDRYYIKQYEEETDKPEAPQFCKDWLSWGAGPRATQYLIIGGKARSVLEGRNHVAIEDIQAVAHPVLRHRIITNFNAEAEGITPDKIIDRLIGEISAKEVNVLPQSTGA